MTSRLSRALAVATIAAALVSAPRAGRAYDVNDAHFHLTNYIQEGTDIRTFLDIMGSRVGRVALFGIPLQQQWSYRVSGDAAPGYYLESDADLYYYSFTDARIAMAYKSLSKKQQARFDPMITGFNPADMYAADHIRRVLETFPGVFTGIGEFTIHKEFVSSKIAGDAASLTDPALDRILDFAGEVGLVVILHSDIHMPFAKPEQARTYFDQTKALFARHPRAIIIWAHTGLGRIVQPLPGHLALLDEIANAPNLAHVFFDISWSEVAKYVVASPESVAATADFLERHPTRVLFGTDEVAPKDQVSYLGIYDQYAPLWQKLSPRTSEQLRIGNYARLFDQGRKKVRAWEAVHVR
ncbi:MAG: amidohydrolase family protein [Deltaproteobacteria bacterium]|nr:amidohydrolase family protein [Deltaproteobacteria bacterium]